jgi:hypothetical protein
MRTYLPPGAIAGIEISEPAELVCRICFHRPMYAGYYGPDSSGALALPTCGRTACIIAHGYLMELAALPEVHGRCTACGS